MLNFSQDERERAIFRRRRMYQTDLASNLATAEDRGRHEGEHKKSIQTARLMLADGEPIEKIIRYSGLSADEIEHLRAQNNCFL